MNEIEYKDIKGNLIKVGDIVISECLHCEPVKIGDLLALDYLYINWWGMLEIRNDLDTNVVLFKGEVKNA